MPDRDTTDFLTAFAIGAGLGVAATLLLRPSPPTARERIMDEIEPYRKRAKKGAKRARKNLRKKAAGARDVGENAVSGGKERLTDFHGEVADILSDARKELASVVDDQVSDLEKALKRMSRS